VVERARTPQASEEPEAERRPAAPAQPGPSMAALARQPAAARAATLARLSPAAGNAVLARVSADWSLTEIDRDVEEAMKPDPAIRIDLGSASPRDKLIEIGRLNEAGLTRAAATVWDSFGTAMADFALANRALFEATLAEQGYLIRHHSFKPFSQDFKKAVEARVRANLAANEFYVTEEMKRLGIAQVGSHDPGVDADRELREFQVQAERVAKAQRAMALAQTIPIGYVEVTPNTLQPGVQKATKRLVYFHPSRKADARKDGDPRYQDWDAVKREYDKLDLFVRMAIARSPGLFAAIGETTARRVWNERGEAAGKLAGHDAGGARGALRPLLQELLEKIDGAKGLVGDDLDYRDVTPVHRQLMQTSEFGGNIERARIAADVKDHNTDGLLRTLGLTVLSAAGFLLASFATGGMAIFIGAAVGAGASGLQAGLSIEDYLDKAAAREARTGDPELDIMSQESVDSAFTAAVLDTAFAILDGMAAVGAVAKIGSPAMKLVRAGEAGMEASAEVGLREAVAWPEGALGRAETIERAVAELGTEGAARAAGMDVRELAKLLPADSHAAAKLLAAADSPLAGAAADAGDLAADLKRLDRLDDERAARAVADAFDRYGYLGTLDLAGGWKVVTKRFGEGHAHVTALEAWRSGLVNEAAGYIKRSSKGDAGAVRTGTERGTSDVDISTFGSDAAQNVERLKEFLARRTGVRRDRLEFLLDADAAVNPSRMHLQDLVKGISEAAHEAILQVSAKHQEKLIFARRWHDAVEARDQHLMRQLDELAAATGIGDIPKTWKPMSPQEIAGLERAIDEWAGQLAKLEKRGGEEAAKRGYIEKIGAAQAEVLANNPNMYLDAGNIKTLVTRRPIDASKIEAALGALDAESLARLGTVFPQERYLKILGEGPHIDHAFRGIRQGENAQKIAEALKAFAKHGQRVLDTIGADVARGLDPRAFDQLSGGFGRILEQAKTPRFVDQAAQNMYEIKARAELQAAQLQKAMATATKALREQAALGAPLNAAQAADLNAWARAESSARAASQALLDDLEKLHKGLLGGKLITHSGDLVDPDPMDPMFGE